MATRSCAKCGEEKNIQGGKICEKGHFVCKGCVNKGWTALTRCPVCETRLT
jgi:hypothetical protein